VSGTEPICFRPPNRGLSIEAVIENASDQPYRFFGPLTLHAEAATAAMIWPPIEIPLFVPFLSTGPDQKTHFGTYPLPFGFRNARLRQTTVVSPVSASTFSDYVGTARIAEPGAADMSDDAALRQLIDEHLSEFDKPGVLSVQPGYRVRDDWLTGERAIVVTVARKVADPPAGPPLTPPPIGTTARSTDHRLDTFVAVRESLLDCGSSAPRRTTRSSRIGSRTSSLPSAGRWKRCDSTEPAAASSWGRRRHRLDPRRIGAG